jgi:hypothetical protein
MRERRPIRFERVRSRRPWRRIAARLGHRRGDAAPDLVEEILGDLGWRRVDRVARRLRQSLRTAFLAAAVLAVGTIALEAADRLASGRQADGLDEAVRRFGEFPASWRQAGWSDWLGGRDLETSASPASERSDEWNGLIAAAPWSPV